MGLDMYLDGVMYFSPLIKPNLKKRKIIMTLEVTWRDAYHIHDWFVENIQNGKDDGNRYELGFNQLNTLRNYCREILNDNSKASELLPTDSTYGYDDFYFKTIEKTYQELSRLIDKPNRYEWFSYYGN